MDIDEGFAALIHPNIKPRVLVLGTLPGVRSLQDHRYYAHPHNSFWWIMAELFGFDHALDYQERIDRVLAQGVGIWDVIASCHRPGSLDSSIDQSTLTPNDFDTLFCRYPSLECIAFNGQAARKLFKKHVEPTLSDKLNHVSLKVMPSTSPAYAAMKREQKLAHWMEIKDFL